jgi:short-subunit dehydrogenase
VNRRWRWLFKRGATAIITDASGGLGQALDSLASQMRRARVVVCDLARRTQAEVLADQVSDAAIVVANAALPAAGKLVDFTPKDIDRALDVNLRVPILMTRQLSSGMLVGGRGHLV